MASPAHPTPRAVSGTTPRSAAHTGPRTASHTAPGAASSASSRPVAVVTGAASGIGRELARELAGRGASLALTDVDEDGLLGLAAELRATGTVVVAEVADVSDREAVLTHAARVECELGPPSLVIANAGIAASGTVLQQDPAHVRRVIEVDLFGVIHTCQAFLPLLVRHGGRLVTVSSVFGLFAAPKQSAYNAAKFGVRGYTESLRQEALLADWPVSVTCVHPGGVRTSIARSALLGEDEDIDATAAMFDLISRTSARAAATRILRGAASGRARVLVGADARVFAAAVRLVGPAYTDLVGRSWWGRRIFTGTGR